MFLLNLKLGLFRCKGHVVGKIPTVMAFAQRREGWIRAYPRITVVLAIIGIAGAGVRRYAVCVCVCVCVCFLGGFCACGDT